MTTQYSYAGYHMQAQFTQSYLRSVNALHSSGFLRHTHIDGSEGNLVFVDKIADYQAVNRGISGAFAIGDDPVDYSHDADAVDLAETAFFPYKMINASKDASGNTIESAILKRDIWRMSVKDLADRGSSDINSPGGQLLYRQRDQVASVNNGMTYHMLNGLFDDGRIKRSGQNAGEKVDLTWDEVSVGDDYTEDKKYADYLQETDLTEAIDAKLIGQALLSEIGRAYGVFDETNNSQMPYVFLPSSVYRDYTRVLSAALGTSTAVEANNQQGYILPGSFRQSVTADFCRYADVMYVRLPDSYFRTITIGTDPDDVTYWRCWILLPEAVKYTIVSRELSNALEFHGVEDLRFSYSNYEEVVRMLNDASMNPPGTLTERANMFRFESNILSSDPSIARVMPSVYSVNGLKNGVVSHVDTIQRGTSSTLALSYRMYSTGQISTARNDPKLMRELLVPLEFTNTPAVLSANAMRRKKSVSRIVSHVVSTDAGAKVSPKVSKSRNPREGTTTVNNDIFERTLRRIKAAVAKRTVGKKAIATTPTRGTTTPGSTGTDIGV